MSKNSKSRSKVWNNNSVEHNAAIKIIINNYDKMLRKKPAENYIHFSTCFH